MSDWISKNVSPQIAEYLFNIKISLPGRHGLFQKDVRADLAIDFDDLEKQLENTPQMLAFFDLLLSEQKYKVATLKRKLTMKRASITQHINQTSRMSGNDLRRTDLVELVEVDGEIKNLENQVIIEEYVESRLIVVVKSIINRSEILRSLAGFKKQERGETRP